MPDDLYDRDILLWSEHQSDLLRRLSRGERVNDAIDWENVIEELESVGRSEIQSCESLLRQAILHLLKLYLEPDSLSQAHWRVETLGFLTDASRRYTPSMAQRLDVQWIYGAARRQIVTRTTADQIPATSPFTLRDLLAPEATVDALLVLMSPVSAG